MDLIERWVSDIHQLRTHNAFHDLALDEKTYICQCSGIKAVIVLSLQHVDISVTASIKTYTGCAPLFVVDKRTRDNKGYSEWQLQYGHRSDIFY